MMKNFFSRIKEKAGYVSIEMIILAGLLLALAVAILSGLNKKGANLAADGSNQVTSANTNYGKIKKDTDFGANSVTAIS